MLEEVCDSAFFFVVKTENIRLVCFVIYVFLQRVESYGYFVFQNMLAV